MYVSCDHGASWRKLQRNINQFSTKERKNYKLLKDVRLTNAEL